MKRRTLTERVESHEELLCTATGTARVALEGSKAAIQTWADLIADFLRNQAGSDSALQGFPESYDDDDARGCLHYMVETLDKIHLGMEPNKAFGWKRSTRGRPPTEISDRLKAIEHDDLLADIEHKMERFGLTLDAAGEAVANHWKVDPEWLLGLAKRNKVRKSRA